MWVDGLVTIDIRHSNFMLFRSEEHDSIRACAAIGGKHTAQDLDGPCRTQYGWIAGSGIVAIAAGCIACDYVITGYRSTVKHARSLPNLGNGCIAGLAAGADDD